MADVMPFQGVSEENKVKIFKSSSSFQATSRQVPLKALSPLLHELGFTSLQRSIFESLTNAALTMKALSLQQLLRFLAMHCSSGGFTARQLLAAREAFDQVRQGREEIAPQGVGAALALFFGQDAYEKWNLLWKRRTWRTLARRMARGKHWPL